MLLLVLLLLPSSRPLNHGAGLVLGVREDAGRCEVTGTVPWSEKSGSYDSITVVFDFKSSKIHIFLSCHYLMQASFVSKCGN